MMMVDYRKYPYGKDGESAPGIELNGVYYPDTDLIIAAIKALIKKGVITKADVVAEL